MAIQWRDMEIHKTQLRVGHPVNLEVRLEVHLELPHNPSSCGCCELMYVENNNGCKKE